MSSGYPAILDELGLGAPVGLRGLGGGCIADAAVAEFADDSRVFIKRVAGQPGMFEAEAAGLRALAEAGAIRLPRVLAVSQDALVLEMIEAAPRKRGFFEDFGRRFAALHRHRGRACGFPQDNFIGATPQPNQPLDAPWESAGEEDIEPPVILHGDLWGGNYIVDDRGEACLIDPAVYYGHREADLAMTQLFGGFDGAFYAAYEASSPLAPGHPERLPIYQLYHVLNHFNLFGGGYYGQSRRILERYAAG